MSIVGGFLLAKGADFALGQAKKAVQNKALQVVKDTAGKAFFGDKLAAQGEIDHEAKLDFRGLERYKAPKPGKLVKFFCGGSVIEGDTLNEQLRDQAIKSFDLERKSAMPQVKRDPDGQKPPVEQVVLDDVAEPEEPKAAEGQAQVVEGQAQQRQQQNVKAEQPVNRPISIEDFRSMVTVEEQGAKRAKNKGYVRFVKCDGGNGVTLGKVGNKMDVLMSWRVNVTKEHNRQMRLLFAETMLADFGGINGVGLDGDNTVYGAALQQQLKDIRTKILNDAHPGDLLKRTTVRECFEKYDAIFGEKSLASIADSFLNECLEQCNYTTNSVEEFLNLYGKSAPQGMQTYKELKALVTNIPAKDGKALKAALAQIAEAFGKMNEVWQQDKAARNFLVAIAENPTSTKEIVPKGKDLDRLRGALLRRMAPEGNAHPNNAEVVNLFFDKAFPSIVDSLRLDFKTAKDAGNPRDEVDLLRKFAARLSLEGVLAEVEDFGKAIREKTMADEQVSPMRLVIQYKEQERAAVIAKLEACQGKDADLEAQLARIQNDLAWLAQQEADFKTGNVKLTDEFLQSMEQKALAEDADPELKRSWSKDGLMSVLIDGAKSLDATFQLDYVVQSYLKTRCQNIAYQFNGDVKAIMDSIVAKFESAMKLALAANVADKGDISPQELITEFADFLMFDVELRELRGDEALVYDRNPNTVIKNARHTAPMLFVEGMMRTAIDLAVNKKATDGTNFADQVKVLKAQSEKLAKVLAKLFVNVKKGKLAGLSGFVSDVRSFQYKGIGNAESVRTQREAFLQGARQLIFVKLMTQFIENDMPDLLGETDIDKFTEAAKNRLDLRVEEAMSAFLASYVQQFYEGTLHLATSVADHTDHLNALDGTDVRDPETGYTNPSDVAEKFLAARAQFDVKGRLEDPKLGRPEFRPLSNADLAGALGRHAERIWRQNVVSHAPGRHWLGLVDILINKFQDFLNVSAVNRQVDITSAWLDKRAADFQKEMSSFLSRYASFEKRFVNACRAEVAKTLESGKDARFAAVRDPAVRERLVDDVLGAFSGEIGQVLTAFIENPKAFAHTGIDNPGIFGSNARLVEFVRDTLGVTLRGATTDVTGTGGFKKISDALGKTIGLRQNCVNLYLQKHGEVSSYVMDTLAQTADTTGYGLLKACFNHQNPTLKNAVSKATTWAIDRNIAIAKANPVEAYEDKGEAFVRKLGERALADLATVAGNFEAQVKALDAKLAAALKAVKFDDNDGALESFLGNERAHVIDEFVVSFCDLAIARTKKSDYVASLEKLVADTVVRFEKCIDGAQKLQSGIREGFFTQAIPAFNAAMHEGEATLLAHGATGGLLLDFSRKCGDLWATLPERLGNSIKVLNDNTYTIDKAVATICKQIGDEIEQLAADYAERLDASSVNFNAEGVEKLLATRGITRADFPDHEAFAATVKAILEDTDVADFFVTAQNSVMGAKAAGEIKPEQFSFVDNNLAPFFKFQYQVLAAQHRVDAQIAEVNERLTALAAERNAPPEVVGGIMGSLTTEMRQVRRTLDVTTSISDFSGFGARGLKPDEVNVEVEKLVAENTKRLDEQLRVYQLEQARKEWLDAHLDHIVARAFSMADQAFDEKLNLGKHAKTLAAEQRTFMVDIIRNFLTLNVLSKGGKDDWDQAMAGVLGKVVGAPLTEAECGLISPELYKTIGTAVTTHATALERDAAEGAIRKEIVDLYDGLNKAILVAHMPSFLDRSKALDYRNLVALNPNYTDPAALAAAYAQKFAGLPEKTRKGLPAPEKVQAFVQVLATAREARLQEIQARLLEGAKPTSRKGKWYYNPDEKATAGMAKELSTAVHAQLKAQKADASAFEAMLKFMLQAR